MFPRRCFQRLLILSSLFLWLLFLGATPSDAADSPPWRILVLHSYHADFAWTEDIMKGIHKVFAKAGKTAEFYIEYMDSKRFPQELAKERLTSFQKHLTEKYRPLQPQIVISVDDDALRFLVDRHESIFFGVPIVFCGVNNPVNEATITAHNVITGVMEVLDRKETIDTALALHPETKKLAIITDTTTNGIGNRLILKELAKAYAGRIQFIFLDEDGTGITLNDLRSRLAKLDDETIVYYGDFFRDKNGFLDQATIVPILSKESRRPIYSPYSFVFGLGTVGGKLNSALFQGETAAQMALQILQGTSPSRIPIIKESINRHMFDFRELARWDIPTSSLPAGSIVMFKRVSFFEEYRLLVIITFIVFMILVAIIAALIISINRRQQAELSLRASERRYRTLTEQMPDITWQKDINGIYVSCNSNYAKVLGVTVETIAGHRDEDFYKPELAAKYHRDDQQVITTGQNLETEELWQDDGKIAWLHTSKAPLSDENGKIIGTIGIARDITERKQAEKEQQELQLRLQRSEKMEALGQLAGGVAHDLNNALGVTMAYAELLLEQAAEESNLRKYASHILKSTEKAAAIIQDLLTLARRGVTVSEVIDVNSIVAAVLKSPEFDKLHDFHPAVTFSKELSEDLLNILGSPVHLEKTLFNLFSNAAEAIGGSGEIAIRTENRYIDSPLQGYDSVQEGDYVVVTVTDTGHGIAAEELKKIFEPFYTKKSMGRSGTGLGLAIVWGTVRDHNGYIDVQSEQGKGTTFTLYFPVTREQVAAEEAKIPVEQYLGKGESVLVIDDVEAQRQVAETLLRRLQYQVAAVGSGEEAIAYLQEHRADILVLDMIMEPGIDGLETYEKILKITPHQKAVIVSGFSETGRVKKAQALGAGPYVRKPYAMRKIGVAIRAELDGK